MASNPDFSFPGAPGFALDRLGDDETAAPAFDLRYAVAALRTNLALIMAIVVACLALALAVSLLQARRYTASAAVQINDQSQRVLGNGVEAGEPVNAAPDTDRFLQTQVDVLHSRALAMRVIQRLHLLGNARFYAQMEARDPGPRDAPLAVREATIKLLQDNVEVRLPRNSRIATISFASADQMLSAQVANAFAEEFIGTSLQQKYDSASYARSFVSGQLQDARLRLEQSERNLNAYARQAGLIRTRDSSSANGESGRGASSITTASLMQLNAAASQARAARIAAQSKLRAAAARTLLSDREAMGNPAVQQLFTQRAGVEAKLDDELTRHLDGHPAVQQLRAQLAVIDRQLQAAAQNLRSSTRAEYEAAVATEANLQAQVDALKAATLGEQDRLVQYTILAREADTNRLLYDGLLQRYKELNASAGIAASNIAIIDRADPPVQPSSPDLALNLAYALLAGLGLAGLAIVLRSQFDDTVRAGEDIEHKLAIPLLGVVPRSHGNDPEAELADPRSPLSEGYNSLRGALLYATAEGLPRRLLVTSSQPGEGKTTTSVAIGQGLARMGRKVLLVDADLRRPSLHRCLGLPNESGLTTLLTSQAGIDSVLAESGLENLSLITAGPVPPSPTELIASPRMQAVVAELAGRFDVVLFDSPPILGLADAPLLSALADGVVLIIESGRTRHGSLKASLRRLRAMRPVLLGAVLTMFDPGKAGPASGVFRFDDPRIEPR